MRLSKSKDEGCSWLPPCDPTHYHGHQNRPKQASNTPSTCLLDARVGAAAQELGGARHLPVVVPLEELVQQRFGAVAVWWWWWWWWYVRPCVCICVCVCVRRREGEREGASGPWLFGGGWCWCEM
jgi:hypothetical protein